MRPPMMILALVLLAGLVACDTQDVLFQDIIASNSKKIVLFYDSAVEEQQHALDLAKMLEHDFPKTPIFTVDFQKNQEEQIFNNIDTPLFFAMNPSKGGAKHFAGELEHPQLLAFLSEQLLDQDEQPAPEAESESLDQRYKREFAEGTTQARLEELLQVASELEGRIARLETLLASEAAAPTQDEPAAPMQEDL
eukprot:gnl/Chilomastix_cuspidata/2381.p2 GENE.gnl/Chilomastix_cuspidata/2381~~gnl/Chilomastix_cuspidata/2381.p2  ORF type:complete len:202 (-),score=73.01 gnl/Chilomastix_cuspidata/2381:610-1191(-)